MTEILSEFGPVFLMLAVVITLLAGFVKGAVGFAMPMIMISGLSSFLPVETALAVLILPTVFANGAQALRQGGRAAWISVRQFRLFLVVGGVFLVSSAQLVPVLPATVLFIVIGAPVTLFALAQLLGWRLRLDPRHRNRTEALVAAVAGGIGGMSGVWGPPTVAYLTALDTPKSDHVRAQGVIYGLGSVALLGAHLRTGIVSAQTLPLSAVMLVPAAIGLWVGFRVHDQLDQARFRRATLVVLVIAGLNLLRRGLF